MSRKFVVPFMLIFALALFGCNLTSTGTTLASHGHSHQHSYCQSGYCGYTLLGNSG